MAFGRGLFAVEAAADDVIRGQENGGSLDRSCSTAELHPLPLERAV
jgi:hypothetical protein